MKRVLLLTLVFLLTLSSYDYCQNNSPNQLLFMYQDEHVVLSPQKFLKGYNLDYYTKKPVDNVKIQQPFIQLAQSSNAFPQDSKLINIDVLKKLNDYKQNPGAVIADTNTQIVVGTMVIEQGVNVPYIENYLHYIKTTQGSSCSSGVVINSKFDVFITCQNAEKSEFCVLNSTTPGISCVQKKYESKAAQRINRFIYSYNYILSASKASQQQQQSEITVFYIDQINSQIIEKMTITKQTLELDSLSIVDIKIGSGNQVYVVSNANNNEQSYLINFKFANEKIVNITKTLSEEPIQKIQFADNGNTMLAAFKTSFKQLNAADLKVKKIFELDNLDNSVVNIQGNNNFIIVHTAQHNQYIYSRKTTDIRYLLHRQSVHDVNIILSSFIDHQYIISIEKIAMFKISHGFVIVQNSKTIQEFVLAAKSGQKQCFVNFKINQVNNLTSTYLKGSSFRQITMISGDSSELILENLIGGNDLSYKITILQQGLHADLRQAQQIVSDDQSKDGLFVQIIGIDNYRFYIATAHQQAISVKACLVEEQKIQCQNHWETKINGTITGMHGARRSTGQIILAWCFDESNFQYVDIKNKGGIGSVTTYPPYHYTSILVGEKYILLTLKKDNLISVYRDKQIIQRIGKSHFSEQQLTSMKGFYPRQILVHPTNPSLFYVRMPTTISLMAIQEGNVRFLGAQEVLEQYIPDTDWTFKVGKQTKAVITQDRVDEYFENTLIHSIKLSAPVQKPVNVLYDAITDVVVVKTTDGKLTFIRLNTPVSENIVWSTNDIVGKISNSWGWTLAFMDKGYKVILVPRFSSLTITGQLPEQQFKRSLALQLNVYGFEGNTLNVSSLVTVVNYPHQIVQVKTDSTILKFPQSANDNKEVYLPMDKFFNGSISKYQISCSYCSKNNITLATPFRLGQSNREIKNLLDIRTFDGVADTFAIASGDNKIFVLDNNNDVIDSINVQHNMICSKLGVFDAVQTYLILAVCSNSVKQQIQHYSIDSDDYSIKYIQSYDVDPVNYIKNPNNIEILFNQQDLLVFIHDNNIAVDTNNKVGNIKVFKFIVNPANLKGQLEMKLHYNQTIDSKTFGVSTSLPINDMDFYGQQHLAVSIGNLGIGYLKLFAPNQFLSNIRFVNLKDDPQMQNYTLQNNIYQGIEILSVDDSGNIKIFLSSTIALHITFNFNFNDQKISKTVAELYNRLGNLKTINWVGINTQRLILAYYNTSNQQLTLCLYNRSSLGLINTYASISTMLPKERLGIRGIGVLQGNVFLSQFTSVPGFSLSLYSFDKQFGLMLNYNSPGNFDTISIVASNAFTHIEHKIKVSFDSNSSGIKWYVVVLIVAAVFLVVGLAFGFYLKAKARKQKKKVSLYTQDGEEDQRI